MPNFALKFNAYTHIDIKHNVIDNEDFIDIYHHAFYNDNSCRFSRL